MATPRLVFLYPHLFKPLRGAYEPLVQHPKPYFRTSRRCITNRHGSAVEHPPFGVPPLARNGRPVGSGGDAVVEKRGDGGALKEEEENKEPAVQEGKEKASDNTTSPSPPIIQGDTSQPPTDPKAPLDPVLQHLPATSLQSPSHHPPQLRLPPYIHHFDTYTLVHTLASSGLPLPLSVTAMKAIRALLSHHLTSAQSHLLPTSSLSNQSYLFASAISELKTEIQNSRAHEAEKLRSERNRLQHEVDILSQKLSQELAALREEMKGLFGDRRMAVRMEQREMEGRIQELNYKITVMLNSDMKSEVEGLRWVLTRRAAMAIATMACELLPPLSFLGPSEEIHGSLDSLTLFPLYHFKVLILGSLRYWSYRAHLEQQQQHQQQSKQPEAQFSQEGSDTPAESKA